MPNRTKPPLTGLIAGGLVICGVLRWMFVSMTNWFEKQKQIESAE